MMIPETIVYLHIPKTGGRSLQNILLRSFSEDEIIVDGHERMDEIAAWPEDRKRKIRYFQGHFIFGAHRLLPQPSRYITTLREPVDRVISHYYFIKRCTAHPLNEIVNKGEIDLEGYVTSGVCDEVSNDQTRMIAGVSREASVSADDMFRMARDNIENQFILAGLVERFDETLLLLKRQLGLRHIFYGVRNQTIGRPLRDNVPGKIQDQIRERNTADIQLYEYVGNSLQHRIDEVGASFSRDVRRFQMLNRPYSDIFHFVRIVKNKLSRVG